MSRKTERKWAEATIGIIHEQEFCYLASVQEIVLSNTLDTKKRRVLDSEGIFPHRKFSAENFLIGREH